MIATLGVSFSPNWRKRASRMNAVPIVAETGQSG